MTPETRQRQGSLAAVVAFLQKLEDAGIWYRLEHFRDSLTIETAVPGERWEIEFFDDGGVEIERFVSTGKIEGPERLASLFELMHS